MSEFWRRLDLHDMRFGQSSAHEPGGKGEPNLRRVRSAATLPLFWVHGDASEVLLEDRLGTEQSLFLLKHQSRDGRPAAYTQVETVAAHYLTQILSVQPEGPYYLGGYSFGGTVAFEAARQLQAAGRHVGLLFMIDSLSPGAGSERPPPNTEGTDCKADHARRHLRTISQMDLPHSLHYIGTRARALLIGRLSLLTRAGRRAAIRACLSLKWRLPRGLISQYLVDVYYRAIKHYAPQPYRGRATYIKSEGRPARHAQRWRSLTSDGLDVHEISGSDHEDIVLGAHAVAWIEILKLSLHTANRIHAVIPTPASSPVDLSPAPVLHTPLVRPKA